MNLKLVHSGQNSASEPRWSSELAALQAEREHRIKNKKKTSPSVWPHCAETVTTQQEVTFTKPPRLKRTLELRLRTCSTTEEPCEAFLWAGGGGVGGLLRITIKNGNKLLRPPIYLMQSTILVKHYYLHYKQLNFKAHKAAGRSPKHWWLRGRGAFRNMHNGVVVPVKAAEKVNLNDSDP